MALLSVSFVCIIMYAQKVYSQIIQPDLEEHLLSNMRRVVRPVEDPHVCINVTLSITLNQIVSVDETSNMITCQYWVKLKWKNQLIHWKPAHWKGKDVVSVRPHQIWTPDIVLYNDGDETLSGSGMKESSFIKVYPDGLNMWKYSITYKSTCLINVKHYPFDYQTCKLKFGSWVYDSNLLRMMKGEDSLIVSDYVNSTEWDIERINIQHNSVRYGNYEGKSYDDVTLTFVIKRNWESQVFVILGPCLLILLTTLFSFSIPPECSERITVIVTNLVAFAVSFDSTSQSLPQNSDYVSTVSLVYNVLFVESTVSLFVACGILKIYHQGSSPNPSPVPRVIQSILSIVYVGKYKSNPVGMAALPSIERFRTKENKNEAPISQYLPSLFEKKEELVERLSKLESINLSKKSDEKIIENTLRETKAEVKVITTFMDNHVRRIQVQNEWRLLANALDWTYFSLFFIFVASTTSYIILSTWSESNKINANGI